MQWQSEQWAISTPALSADIAASVTPAARHCRFSLASVPLLSPRDTNGVSPVVIAFRALMTSFPAMSARLTLWPRKPGLQQRGNIEAFDGAAAAQGFVFV
jgi:hypothetical protein